MKIIASNYNYNPDWIAKETDDYIIYDRSDNDECVQHIPKENIIKVPNIGSDIADKLQYIIDNYDNLPDVAIYTKSNLFNYISREEFDKVCNNTTFTPLLTQHHKVYEPVCRYVDGMYYEVNNYWYLHHYPSKRADELIDFLGMRDRKYNAFAPGSSYILTRNDILRHSKQFYKKLHSFLSWAVYPGEAQIIERNLYYIWGTDIIRT